MPCIMWCSHCSERRGHVWNFKRIYSHLIPGVESRVYCKALVPLSKLEESILPKGIITLVALLCNPHNTKRSILSGAHIWVNLHILIPQSVKANMSYPLLASIRFAGWGQQGSVWQGVRRCWVQGHRRRGKGRGERTGAFLNPWRQKNWLWTVVEAPCSEGGTCVG